MRRFDDSKLIPFTLVWALAGTLSACSADSPSEQLGTGEAELALSSVPEDVGCIAVTATADVGSLVERYDVAPGQEFSTLMAGLPFGPVQFSGEAFDSDCASVTEASIGSWASSLVNETVQPGTVNVVTLVMRRNGRVCVEVTFEDDFATPATGSDEDLCTLPAEVGPCDAVIPRYYFDAEAGACKRFSYGGCGGNENNFATLQACNSACRVQVGGCVKSACDLPAGVAGPCEAAIRRWTFNNDSGRCERFVFGGCGGNANNFQTRAECEGQCSPEQSPCSQANCQLGQECRIFEPTGEAYCADTCKGRECPQGGVCELVDVVCIRAPCPPVAQCVSDSGEE